MRLRINYQVGFSLIELLIVIAVISILSTIVLFGLNKTQGAARNTERMATAKAIQSNLQRYYGDNNSSYPINISQLAPYFSGFLDPGCGGGRQMIDIATNNNNNLVPSGCSDVTYVYYGGGGGYSIVLFKEDGGSNVFYSPQY